MIVNKKRIFGIVAIIALVAILGVCLVACNADSYATKLAKKGYKVDVYKADEFSYYSDEIPDSLSEGEGQIEWTVRAVRMFENKYGDIDTYSVTITKYKTKAAAQDMYDKLEDEYKWSSGSHNYNMSYELKGKILIYGDREAVDDAN